APAPPAPPAAPAAPAPPAPPAPPARAVRADSVPVVLFGTGDPEPAADHGPTEPIPSVPLTADALFGDIDDASARAAAVVAPVSTVTDAVLALEQEARAALDADDYAAAVERLAEALRIDPRNRALRALYHVACGHELAEQGKPVEATTQFETALRHDPGCPEAREALSTRRASKRSKGLFGRWRR
ncbi:MAG: hypothetical protein D6689_15635, partial [Deltaproteobacteria bacterium]